MSSSLARVDNSVQNLEPVTFQDFEFANNAVEMLRDTALRIPALSERSIRSIYDALASVMPHLEVCSFVIPVKRHLSKRRPQCCSGSNQIPKSREEQAEIHQGYLFDDPSDARGGLAGLDSQRRGKPFQPTL